MTQPKTSIRGLNFENGVDKEWRYIRNWDSQLDWKDKLAHMLILRPSQNWCWQKWSSIEKTQCQSWINETRNRETNAYVGAVKERKKQRSDRTERQDRLTWINFVKIIIWMSRHNQKWNYTSKYRRNWPRRKDLV